MKKSKSGINEADIKPYIHKLEIIKNEGRYITFKMCVAAGNTYNLKPETVLDGLSKYQPDFKAEFISVHRNKILAGKTEYLK